MFPGFETVISKVSVPKDLSDLAARIDSETHIGSEPPNPTFLLFFCAYSVHINLTINFQVLHASCPPLGLNYWILNPRDISKRKTVYPNNGIIQRQFSKGAIDKDRTRVKGKD